jgi:hypothetical protein
LLQRVTWGTAFCNEKQLCMFPGVQVGQVQWLQHQAAFNNHVHVNTANFRPRDWIKMSDEFNFPVTAPMRKRAVYIVCWLSYQNSLEKIRKQWKCRRGSSVKFLFRCVLKVLVIQMCYCYTWKLSMVFERENFRIGGRRGSRYSVQTSFLIYTKSLGLLKAASYTQNNTNIEYTHTDIHASSGIQTHDPSVGATEVGSCLRQRGRCDRQLLTVETVIRFIRMSNLFSSSTERAGVSENEAPYWGRKNGGSKEDGEIWMRRVIICIRHKIIRTITSKEVKSPGQVERPNKSNTFKKKLNVDVNTCYRWLSETVFFASDN